MVITIKEDGMRFGARAGAIIYNEDKTKVLLENQDNERYMFPGGRIDVHEDSEAAIVRELKEELNLETDLKSEFKASGINQTLHRIYLEIKCNVIILTPFQTIEEPVINQVLLAEGVIVGEVPNSYYNLEGISKDNALDIIE